MPAAASESPSISWRVYDDEFKLSHVLTEAARACVAARATHPSEFLLAYFAQATRGDRVEQLSCAPVLSSTEVDANVAGAAARTGVLAADVAQGLRVSVRLFTHTEATVTVTRLPIVAAPAQEPSDGVLPVLDGAAVAEALMSLLCGPLPQRLRAIGVYAQSEWDAILAAQRMPFTASGPPVGTGPAAPAAPAALAAARLSRTSSGSTGANAGAAGPAGTVAATAATPAAEAEHVTMACNVPLPCTAQFAVSLTACLAAARSLGRPLHRHIHTLAAEAAVTGEATREEVAESATVALPQLLLPFFGAASRSSVPPAGCVYMHTLYLLPSPGATGMLAEPLMRKLVDAYRVLSERFNRPPVRSDGAIVLDCFENITDAVQAAVDALTSVGLTVGEDVLLGVRLAPPVVVLGAAAFGLSAAPPSAHRDSASATGSATQKKAAGGAAAAAKKGGGTAKQQAAANPLDFVYGVFSGDPDVTGPQLAEYLRQQVVECEGRLAVLQDSHHPADVASRARLQRALRTTSCATCVTTAAPWPGDGEAAGADVDSVMVDLMGHGTLTSLAHACRTHQQRGRDVVLSVNPHELQPLTAVVDAAVGLAVTYVSFGAPTLASVCATLSHLHDTQTHLHARRCLAARGAPAGSVAVEAAAAGEDTALDGEEPVPEIKRRNDKKRKKGK